MKFKKFIQELNNSQDYFQEWVQDINNESIYYYWRNSERGYKIDLSTSVFENISESENYVYKTFDNNVLKEKLNILLAKRLDELNKLDNYDDIFEKWLMDEEDNSKYYYWKGRNNGYLAIVENDEVKLPRIKNIERVDGNYLEPSIMKEFKDYKVKRALNKKLDEIKNENIESEKNIFGQWTEDKDNDGTYYYWKNEKEGYIALIENNPLPEIINFEIVDNEYFEPRTLEPVTNHKVKKVLDKKISRR